jgi:RNA polymerase sigma-70 factor, ECF subfamily
VATNERELIRKSIEGEEGAFDMLVMQHRESVFRHCLGIVKDEEIAQDLTQETFVHAFQHLATFRMESRFSTWLWRIAHNLSLNYLKKNRTITLEFKEEILPSKWIKEENEDLLLKIQDAMQHLSPKHRLVFELFELKHIPQKQIAAELGISYGTVRSRLFYARKKIKQFLQEV